MRPMGETVLTLEHGTHDLSGNNATEASERSPQLTMGTLLTAGQEKRESLQKRSCPEDRQLQAVPNVLPSKGDQGRRRKQQDAVRSCHCAKHQNGRVENSRSARL